MTVRACVRVYVCIDFQGSMPGSNLRLLSSDLFDVSVTVSIEAAISNLNVVKLTKAQNVCVVLTLKFICYMSEISVRDCVTEFMYN
jgi:hypothetical protein